MNPNEQPALDPATEAAIEQTETVADEILGEVKECQQKVRQISEGLQSLRENGASREQITEAMTELREARLQLSELLQTANNSRVELQSLSERMTALESRPSISPDSPQSIPSTPQVQTLPVVNPSDVDASPAAETRPRRKVIR